MKRGDLNVDIPGSVARFESLMNKILHKKIFYKLLLRGKGLEFDGYRTFGNEEDAGLIDWKASVRANTLLARQYIEERDIKVMIVLDVGENMVFGSQDKLKCEYCAEIASALANVILDSGDQVGYILFSKDIIRINPPTPGKKQFDIFVHEITDSYNYNGISDLGNILDRIINRLNPSISLVILISDFLRVNENQKEGFEMLGNTYETFAIMVKDPLDKTLPNIDKEVVLEDFGSGEKLLINPSISKAAYEAIAKRQTEIVEGIFSKSNIDLLELETDDDFAFNLANFLKGRVDNKQQI